MTQSFPLRIRESREAARLSLTKAAELIGCSKAHLWELERGNSFNPSIEILAGMAAAYQIDLGPLAVCCAASLPQSPYREAVQEFAAASARLRLVRSTPTEI